MRKLFFWFNFSQTVILTISLIGILLLNNFLCSPVYAHPLNFVKVTGVKTLPLIAKLPTLEDNQAFLEKDIKSVNEALKNLPELFEEVVVSMNTADLARKRNVLVRAQKQLEASAKAYEKRAAQLEQELLPSIRRI